MKSERGIPLSQGGQRAVLRRGPVGCEGRRGECPRCSPGAPTRWIPQFEAAALKNSDGVYYDAMAGLSYGDYSIEEAAEVLVEGISAVLEAN